MKFLSGKHIPNYKKKKKKKKNPNLSSSTNPKFPAQKPKNRKIKK